MPASCRLMDW